MSPTKRRRAPLRPIEFLTLAALSEVPRHGYGLVQEVAQQTEGQIQLRPGDLYRVLVRLEQRELLAISDRRPTPEMDDQRRTYYRLTDLGREILRAEAEMLSKVSQNVLSKVHTEVTP
ncbi:MAG: PadR family transcriptional regulator [Deltaproteobacteria bacterium]|nr:PadR family transcriptional regulator [Deltaproteobacteria bacterium]